METTTYWYALCAVVLFLKMFALSSYQGLYRLTRRTFVNPEDAKLFKEPVAEAELPQVSRAGKAWRNDLENIPIFLGLGTAYIFIGASPEAATIIFPIFTIARILHTVTYLFGLQPWRSISFAVGILCLFAMSWNIGAVLLGLA